MCDTNNQPVEQEIGIKLLKYGILKKNKCNNKKKDQEILVKIEQFDREKLKKYKTTELLNEAENIILRKELGERPKDKLRSILDTPNGSYFGPKTLHHVPAVQYKKNLLQNPAFCKAYCVRNLKN